MTTRISVTIRSPADRERAHDLVRTAAFGSRVEIKQEKRSPEQNSRFWAMLGDVAEQLTWQGQKLDAEDWKKIFVSTLRREMRLVPNSDGSGFVDLGRYSSSDLSKEEFSDLIEIVAAFGAQHDVKFHDPDQSNSSDPTPGNRTIAPAAADPAPNTSAAAGAPIQEASLLSDDWRHVYITTLTSPRDRPESLLTRHNQALQMLGGAPNGRETAWMRLAYGLVKRRNEGRLDPGRFESQKVELLDMDLPVEEKAA